MAPLVKRELFGGAITAEAPHNFIDASDIRQVPNTQEVLLDPHSSLSIIVEILQRVEHSQSDEAIKFHFNSLAHDNDAQASTVDSVSVISNERGDDTPSAVILEGKQHVPKFNRAHLDRVKILMALFRVEQKAIDLVVTFNIPIESADGGALGPEGVSNAELLFNAFVRSLRIVDFSLFA